MVWTDGQLRAVFEGAGDFVARKLEFAGHGLYGYMIDGLVAGADVAEFVFRPLAQAREMPLEGLYRQALDGKIYNSVAEDCPELSAAVDKLVNGYCVVLFPGVGAVAFEVKTGEKRGISDPTVENTVKGPKDAFTETMRINTSLLRRHLRTPKLRLGQSVVGERSRTAVTVVWIEGLTNPELVRRLEQRVAAMNIDGLLSPAAVEEYVTGSRATPFPLLQYTQRPDKFAQGLLSGRVGLMVDGLPLGYLLPVDLGYLMTSPEDLGKDFVSASAIRILRYCAMALTLLLPGMYVALATFHQQMIPLPLLRTMIESKENVPFSTAVEVIALLVAFELLQEAGIHLPQSIGQSVSIIGGIVVGTAAVEAGFISPGALIVVSLAGICGFSLPNRDFAEALRVCRFALAICGSLAGLFGVTVGLLMLLMHLAGLTSLGNPYLAPYASMEPPELLRPRLSRDRYRPGSLRPLDRRNQG